MKQIAGRVFNFYIRAAARRSSDSVNDGDRLDKVPTKTPNGLRYWWRGDAASGWPLMGNGSLLFEALPPKYDEDGTDNGEDRSKGKGESPPEDGPCRQEG